MLFPSHVFLLFFLPLLLLLYYTIFRKSTHWQNILLFAASIFFYAWGEPVYVFLLLLSTVYDYIFGRIIDKYRGTIKAKAALIGSICANLSILFFFKYSDFLIININAFTGADIPLLNLPLPIGISFYTFQTMSYTIDLYRNQATVQKKPLHFAMYVTMFPQLVAGPIVRYKTIQDEIDNRSFNWDDFSSGITKFIIGLGKKVIVANTIALAADSAFGYAPSELSVAAAWLGAAAYALQIYFDFSGYSDMAIGLGRMFGFHFMENFNYPYIARSISDFWRRWHISLSSWFRDYVYFPLGGSRVEGKPRLVFNLFVVWALTGVWHGAAWTFIFWGLFYFVLIAFEKVTGFGKKIEKLPVISNIYVLVCVLIGWVFFRADSMGHALEYLQSMFALNSNQFISNDAIWIAQEYSFTWIIGIIGSIPIVKWLSSKSLAETIPCTLAKWAYLAFITILSMALITGSNYNPFIYFNF